MSISVRSRQELEAGLRQALEEKFDIYRERRKTGFMMNAGSALRQARAHRPPPAVVWEDKSKYTFPERGSLREGDFIFTIEVKADDDGGEVNFYGKLESATDHRGCGHTETVNVGKRRGVDICPYCNRPERGEGALIVWTDPHSGGQEAAWFRPDSMSGVASERAYYIKNNYGKAQAQELAQEFLAEECKTMKKILQNDISFVGVRVKCSVGGIELAEESTWGITYEDEESMGYVLDVAGELISDTRHAAIHKGLREKIDEAKEDLRALLSIMSRMGTRTLIEGEEEIIKALAVGAEKETVK
jgi:hypothetical protein